MKVEWCGLGSAGSRWGPLAVSFGYGNELSDSIQGRLFLNYLSDYWLFKKDLPHGVH
jgi:hypothetical protein